MVRRGQCQRGAVIMSAGRVQRIASALDPGQPGGTGRRGHLSRARAASGQCPAPWDSRGPEGVVPARRPGPAPRRAVPILAGQATGAAPN